MLLESSTPSRCVEAQAPQHNSPTVVFIAHRENPFPLHTPPCLRFNAVEMFELSRLPLGDAAASSRFGSRSVALKTLRFSCFRNRATLCEKCTPPNVNSVAASLCMPRTRRTTHSLNNPALLLELARLSPKHKSQPPLASNGCNC